MIILLGFPKSGTTSFNKLFEQLGYRSYHWRKDGQFIGLLIRENKRKKKPLLNQFKQNDCITQMDACLQKGESYWPQITDFKKIYFQNKKSIFILNKRDPYKILESFKNWNNYLKRLFTYSPHLVKDKTEAGFIDWVNHHYNKVEAFFKERPSAKFIAFDIEKDNLSKLSKYIDLKGITQFPWENKKTDKLDKNKTKKKTPIFKSLKSISKKNLVESKGA